MLEQPYDDRDGWIWMDGAWHPWREARVHILTHGLHYASSVFEGTRAYDGKIFRCEQHTARLFHSAEIMRMKIPFTQDEINAVTHEVIARNKLTDAYIRPIVWRGPEQMGLAGYKTKTHIAVAAWFWPSYYSPEQHARGLRLCMSNWQRAAPNVMPVHAKAAAIYGTGTLAKQEADAAGYDDALMLDYQGNIAEASAANIFFYSEGVWHTPNPDSFLNGITRQVAIELIERRGGTVNVRYIRPEELPTFEQCFLTGTAAEIAPVGQIAEHAYKVGEEVLQLAADYQAEVRK